MQAEVKEKTKAWEEGKNDSWDASQGHEASTMYWTERAYKEHDVQADSCKSDENCINITHDIFGPGLNVCLLRVQNEGGRFSSFLPFFKCLLKLLLQAKIRFFMDIIFITSLCDVVGVLGHFGFL